MSRTVEIYVKYRGDDLLLAHQVAQMLGVTGYFFNGDSYVLPVNAQHWIGEPHWGHLHLDATDLGFDGESGLAAGTAFAPYEYELSLEFRDGRPGGHTTIERFGRAIFDRLTGLDLPMLYAESGAGVAYADFVPGRGVREFPPATDAEHEGRTWWFEPRMHTDPAAPWPDQATPRWTLRDRVLVFEAGGLVQVVPLVEEAGQWHWATPVTSARSSTGDRHIGFMLMCAQPATPSGKVDMEHLARAIRMSTEDFVRHSVLIELRAQDQELIAIPRVTSTREAVDHLRHRGPMPQEPHVLGELVLGLIAAVRPQARQDGPTATSPRRYVGDPPSLAAVLASGRLAGHDASEDP